MVRSRSYTIQNQRNMMCVVFIFFFGYFLLSLINKKESWYSHAHRRALFMLNFVISHSMISADAFFFIFHSLTQVFLDVRRSHLVFFYFFIFRWLFHIFFCCVACVLFPKRLSFFSAQIVYILTFMNWKTSL